MGDILKSVSDSIKSTSDSVAGSVRSTTGNYVADTLKSAGDLVSPIEKPAAVLVDPVYLRVIVSEAVDRQYHHRRWRACWAQA